MRKNIVVSMLIIALAAALLGGATFAWFTDREEVAATFTAGTIILGVTPATEFTVANIAPGWGVDESVTWPINIQNAGTLAMYYRLSFTGSGTLGEVLQVSLDNVLWSDLNDFGYSDAAQVAAGATANITLYFRLPKDVGNAYQGANFTGTFVVDATQVAHQDPDAIDWTDVAPLP